MEELISIIEKYVERQDTFIKSQIKALESAAVAIKSVDGIYKQKTDDLLIKIAQLENRVRILEAK